MFLGGRYIERAAALLDSQEGDPRCRLVDAAEQFWKATMFIDEWPEAVQRAAEGVTRRLMTHGNFRQSIECMEPDEVATAGRQLRGFIEAFLAQRG